MEDFNGMPGLRWSEQELADHMAKKGTVIPLTNPKPNSRGGHKPGKMNKSETAFAGHLDIRKLGGEVVDWKFESIKLKLADNTYFIPDFNVEMANGDLVMCEVKRLWKGKRSPHWEDDARVKIKVAAETFRAWFSFYGVHFDGEKWVYEGF